MDILLRVLGPLMVLLAVFLIGFVACEHTTQRGDAVDLRQLQAKEMLKQGMAVCACGQSHPGLIIAAKRPPNFRFADAQCRAPDLGWDRCISLSWLISLCIFLALCLLGGFHAYLVVTNQTTIEFHINMGNRHAAKRKGEVYRNPYDLGHSRNFQEVFGPNRFLHFLWMMPYLAKRRNIAVVAEQTPNPDSALVMFYPTERDVLGEGIQTMRFSNKCRNKCWSSPVCITLDTLDVGYETSDSPLAAAIFKVKGVNEVLLAAKHVTVTKTPSSDWNLLQPNLELVISQFYAAGLEALRDGVPRTAQRADAQVFDPESIEGRILHLLEERVRPFVQQDGGDVEFDRFDNDSGVLYLRMIGACSGCPKSSVTLNMGIRNLMEHYIPEVKDVLPTDD
ncbi:NFU1 iron-sulfur cluster scaffold homolog [Durusdinium trenchii]|uniref:Mitochondrial n=1 Tax=Durusdinium trenchii TaxID=1381693 RepID=A0ABP0LRI5_9DINO